MKSIDIFDDDYLAHINKIKLPATKIQLLQLAKEIKAKLILLLHKHKFPPVANDDVYMGVLSQAENFKQHHITTLH